MLPRCFERPAGKHRFANIQRTLSTFLEFVVALQVGGGCSEEPQSSSTFWQGRRRGEKSIYAHTNTICRRLSENVATAFTWNRNVQNLEAKHLIGLHFSQQSRKCPKVCTCRTYSVLLPTFVAGAHRNDMLEVDSTEALSSPSVRQAKFQHRIIHFVDQGNIPLART